LHVHYPQFNENFGISDTTLQRQIQGYQFPLFWGLNNVYKNSLGDEIANVNFYAVRPEATQIR